MGKGARKRNCPVPFLPPPPCLEDNAAQRPNVEKGGRSSAESLWLSNRNRRIHQLIRQRGLFRSLVSASLALPANNSVRGWSQG